jgi:hypothetical protein
MAQTRVVEEQLWELERRAQVAFEAADLNGIYSIQGRLRRLRACLVDERSAALADRIRDLCLGNGKQVLVQHRFRRTHGLPEGVG